MKKIFLSLLLTLFLTSCSNPFSVGTLTWTAINVNAYIQQGDSHLISKNGKHILIDVGHSTYAQKILIPTLKKYGVKILPTSYEREYNSGATTQVPTGLVIGVDRRVSKKIGFNGRFVKYEKVSTV